MMSKRFLALVVVSCAILYALAAPATRARVQKTRGANNQPPRVELKVENSKAARAVVSEIEAAGLAKLLRRGGSGEQPPRPLLVNFWATWCDPCREEFPDLVKIDKDYRPRGLDFAFVSLDELAEIKTGVPQFIEKMGAAHIPSFLLNVADPETAIVAVNKDWRGELPATFLFDAEGRLVFKHMGRIKPAELRAAIDKTLASQAPTKTR